jgi:hypothetical protein
MIMELLTEYYEHSGPANTSRVIERVKTFSERSDIESIIVATTSGETAILAKESLSSHRIIAVTHSTGFQRENEQQLIPENRERLESMGVQVLTCQHALAGISRAVRFKLKTYALDEIIAYTLRTLGHGLKVAVEICMMAADAGLVRTDQDVISIGGTGSGADTAAVIRPANVSRFFDLQVRGILCKPWEKA